MSGIGGTMASDLAILIFNNTNAPLVGDTTGLRGSSTAGNFYVSLHTGTLTDASDQTSNECTYTGYARVAVARTAGGWTVTGTSPAQVVNAATVTFGKDTAGTETATYAAIGTDSTGTGKIVAWGALSSPLAISVNIVPEFLPGTLVFTLT